MINDEEVQLRVAFYLRVSTEEQAEKYGLDAQKAAVEGVIRSRGKLKNGEDALKLTDQKFVYVDDGISGTTELDERPAFARLKEDILNTPEGQKPFDMVAVYKLDRFARRLKILIEVIDFFEDKGIKFISATESIDTSTPFGRAMLGIMGVIAELELETIRERMFRGKEQAIIQGVFMGTHPRFGYKKDEDGRLAILEEEAEIVRRIFSMFVVEKISVQKIADKLTEDEILSPDASAIKNGKRKGSIQKKNAPTFWRQERIREILSDEVYTGTYYYDKSKKGKMQPKSEWKESPHRHDSIIPTQLFQLTQQYLMELSDRKALTKKKEQGSLYLLSGLLKCDHCKDLGHTHEDGLMSWTGDRKTVKDTQTISHYYHCNRKNKAKFSIICPTVPIPAEPLENYVIDFIKRLLSNPKQTYEYQKGLKSNKLEGERLRRKEEDKKRYQGLINALPIRKQNLLDQHAELHAIDTPTLKLKLKELDVKKNDYEKKIEDIDFDLSQAMLSKGYEMSLNMFAEKYKNALTTITDNKKELYDLIHRLIYQIVVYSRPKNEKDVIAGRKKNNQMIPERIDIYLNLPQNLMQELYSQRFGVRSGDLWTHWELNPEYVNANDALYRLTMSPKNKTPLSFDKLRTSPLKKGRSL